MLFRSLDKHSGGDRKSQQIGIKLPGGGKFDLSKSKTLKDAGLSTSVAHRFEKIAAIPEVEFETVIAQAKSKNRPVTIPENLQDLIR